MTYLGDFLEDGLVHHIWSSNDGAGASITRATDGTISVYKNNGLTQSVAGITDTEDFDSLTGIHALTIDLSSDAFYAAGANYTVVLSGATIDGQTVNAVLAHFSIENKIAGAKLVWDRALTGATHNGATTAGRRLRTLQEFQGYENGSIWVDTVNGVAGTVNFENGTVENPVLTLADALTLATSLSMTRFTIINGSTITLTSTLNNYVFFGDRWTLDLNGQDVGGTHFEGAEISGVSLGTEAHYHNCNFSTVTLSNSHATHCRFSGTITLSSTGDYHFSDCHSGIAGTSAPIIDMGVAVVDVNLNIRHYSGGIDLRNLGQAGTDTISMEGNGQLILNANCVGGEVAIRGLIKLVDNSSGVAIDDDSRYSRSLQSYVNWEEDLTGHNTNNTAGKILRLLKELNVYSEAAIYVDTVNGVAGTEDFENGTILNPVNNIADAKILAVSLGFAKFILATGSSITLASAFNNYYFTGSGWIIDLGGQDIGGSTIERALVSGIATGSSIIHFRKCGISTVTVPPCHFHRCGISGDITAGSVGSFTFDHSYSSVPGTGTPSFDFGATIGDVGLNVRFQSGGLEIKNYNALGTDTMSLEGFGQLVVNANCTGGIVVIRGHFTITDNAGGAVTFSDDARYDVTQIYSQIVKFMSTDTTSELSAIPNATPTRDEMQKFIYQYFRNYKTMTATEEKLYKNDGTTELGTSVMTDDLTTSTKGRMT